MLAEDKALGDRADNALARAMRCLAVDAVTAEVAGAMQDAGLDPVLLKGPALARWLYDDPGERTYLDTDLLVAPAAVRQAEQLLAQLGFHPQPKQEFPTESRSTWLRGERAVDLHHALPYTRASPETSWSLIASRRDTLTIGGRSVSTLAPTARRLHVATHAAQHHGGGWSRTDLERTLDCSDAGDWREVLTLADRVGARDALAAGLRVADGGEELCRTLGIGEPQNLEVLLRGVPVAEALWRLGRLSAAGQARFVLRKLFPSRALLRTWATIWGHTGSPARLYVARMVWIARRLPAAIDAWRRARRKVRGA